MQAIGVWRSWLARAVWDREVEGSSPFTPTIYRYLILRNGRMAYTYTSTSAIFRAGEHAPSAVDAAQGEPIVNQFGNIALSGLEVDGHTVVLDETVEPPVLRLARAMVTAVSGYTDEGGSFVRTGTYANRARVSGVYAGPRSELDLC